MPYYEKQTKSGDMLYRDLYHSLRPAGIYFPRGKNQMKSSRYQADRNEINSKRYLEQLVNANFGPGDLHIVLTYRDPAPSLDDAKKDLAKYTRSLREIVKKDGVIKWIAVTEGRDGRRIHHHMIISGINYNLACQLWETKPDPAHRGQRCKWDGHGAIRFEALDNKGDYKPLTDYLCKENKPGEHSWTSSKNLKKPEVVLFREVNLREITEERSDPQIPDGYYITDENRYLDKYGYWQLHFKCKKLSGERLKKELAKFQSLKNVGSKRYTDKLLSALPYCQSNLCVKDMLTCEEIHIRGLDAGKALGTHLKPLFLYKIFACSTRLFCEAQQAVTEREKRKGGRL